MQDELYESETNNDETRRGFVTKSLLAGAILSGKMKSTAYANQSKEASLTALSATELARLIRDKKASSQEVVQAHLDRIEKVLAG